MIDEARRRVQRGFPAVLALETLKRYKNGPLFNPPILGSLTGLLGALQVGNAGGGTNWPGGAFDVETGIVYAQANNAGLGSMSLRKPPPGFSDMNYVSGREGTQFVEALGPGFGTAADSPLANRPATPPPAPPAAVQVPPLNVEGLPMMKPPYGVLSAINLEKGELIFQVPHGDTPDNVRNHPKLQGLTVPKTGQAGSVGVVVTKALVVLGDPQVTAPQGRARGAMLRAYNKQTGAQVGEVLMPAQQSGSPMTYLVDGRQYILVAVSGGNYPGEYLAFALPQSEIRPTTQGR